MELNVSVKKQKCSLIFTGLFTRLRSVASVNRVAIYGLPEGLAARMFGLTVQDNMKWNDHINNIVKQASKRLYMLRLLKRSNARIDTLITVYTTIIRPVLEYACQIWHYNIQQYVCEDIENG
jgi:hypothetical protein